MTEYEVRQQLLQFENRDVIRMWFQRIHNRELSHSRAQEINSAAKQSSEFFRNAAQSSYIVKPLLTFYAINSLSRALVLLLRNNGGEATIKPGHGLSAINWNNVLFSDNLSDSLRKIGSLEVKVCGGLFSELIKTINNTSLIHVYSENVDWNLQYDIPQLGMITNLNEFLTRIPDFSKDIENINLIKKYASVSEMSYSESEGFKCKVFSCNEVIRKYLHESGYNESEEQNYTTFSCNSSIFKEHLPLFLHKYVDKTFGTIPQLYIIEPFNGNQYLSEIGMSYVVAYFLGMLVRYYPTHWSALIYGTNGDIYWPILNRAIHYTERVFPELVVEFINYILNKK